MREEERSEGLERFWAAYRQATPEPEASPNFMPELWARIEAERSVGWIAPFEWLAARLVPVAAALTLAMGVLVWNSNGSSLHFGNSTSVSYVDVLASDLLEEQRPSWLLVSREEAFR